MIAVEYDHLRYAEKSMPLHLWRRTLRAELQLFLVQLLVLFLRQVLPECLALLSYGPTVLLRRRHILSSVS